MAKILETNDLGRLEAQLTALAPPSIRDGLILSGTRARMIPRAVGISTKRKASWTAVAVLWLAALAGGQAHECLDVHIAQRCPPHSTPWEKRVTRNSSKCRGGCRHRWQCQGDPGKASFTEHVCRSNNPHCKCFSFRRRDETHHNPQSGAGHRACVLSEWSLRW